ncbi:MAG: hypothetical protein Q8M43_02800, partial [Sulfuricurvum sp.]|uniref:hypothetical protein n=1 Tax=Sulfuricurvum sp. TaxID=2025608 RepID=UPI0027351442
MKNKLRKLFFENFQENEFIHGRYISIIGLILSLGLIYGIWSFSERFLRIGGCEWQMYYSSSSAYSSHYPKLFALIGLIVYLMMYIIIELLRKWALLKKQTQALQHEKELAQTYLDIAAVMV